MTMTSKELEILHRHIDLCKNYLEFGSGESTIYAATRPSVDHIDSVESSQTFIEEHLASDKIILQALKHGKLLFHITDIGVVGKWGYPINNEKKHLWPNYSLSIFSQKRIHDLVLVDGRFRVACALNSFLNTSPDCKIIIHDFLNRPEYKVVLCCLEMVYQVDTLAVFKKKKVFDLKNIQSLIRKYQYLPDDKLISTRIRNRFKKQRILIISKRQVKQD